MFLELAASSGYNAAVASALTEHWKCETAAYELRRFLVNHSVPEESLKAIKSP